jgi:hypothetical protein
LIATKDEINVYKEILVHSYLKNYTVHFVLVPENLNSIGDTAYCGKTLILLL